MRAYYVYRQIRLQPVSNSIVSTFLSVHFAIQHILAENYGNDLICKQQWDMPRSHSESSTDDWLHNCKVEAEVEHDEGGDL